MKLQLGTVLPPLQQGEAGTDAGAFLLRGGEGGDWARTMGTRGRFWIKGTRGDGSGQRGTFYWF